MNTETETETLESVDAHQPLDLQMDVKETSACGRHVTVTIPRNEIERYYSNQFDKIAPMAELPGFRTGKAPRNLIEKKFRKQVADQVKSGLLMDSLTQISDSEVFSAISEPDLDFHQVNVPDDGDLIFEFNIEVRPDFDLPKWKNIDLTRPEHDFTDADVEAEAMRIVSRFTPAAPVEEAVQAGDIIECNITAKHDGEVISNEEEMTVNVRPKLSLADATIEDFEKLVVGAKAEETRSIKVTVNEFSENVEMAGKEVEIEFEILEVKRVASDLKSALERLDMKEEELRTNIRNSLEDQLKYRQRETIRDQISSSLTESANWEIPQDLLRRQSRRELERSVMEMRSSGFGEDEIRLRENDLRSNILERTERLLREHFILERIAEEEKVEETEADYTAEIARIAAQQNDSPRRVRARLERNGQMDSLRNMIIEGKVIEMITEAATIKAIAWEPPNEQQIEAIPFFAAGQVANIPEAKYEGGDATPIPGVKPERE